LSDLTMRTSCSLMPSYGGSNSSCSLCMKTA
jgi:hypothetical protein